jgi:hypothetical protein
MKLSQLAGFSVVLLAGYACGSGGAGTAPTLQVQSDNKGPQFQSGSKGLTLPFSDNAGLASPSTDNTGAFSPISDDPGVFAPAPGAGAGSADCVAVCQRTQAVQCAAPATDATDAGTKTTVQVNCQDTCDLVATQYAKTGCSSQLQAVLACAATAEIHCNNQGEVTVHGCDAQGEALDACGSPTSTGAGGSRGAGGSDFPGTGGSTGLGGTTGTGTHTCADLQACCTAASTDLQPACNQTVTGAQAAGESYCSLAYSSVQSVYCPTR